MPNTDRRIERTKFAREASMREYELLFYQLHGRKLHLTNAGAWIRGASSTVTTPAKLQRELINMRKQLLLRDAAQHELDMGGNDD